MLSSGGVVSSRSRLPHWLRVFGVAGLTETRRELTELLAASPLPLPLAQAWGLQILSLMAWTLAKPWGPSPKPQANLQQQLPPHQTRGEILEGAQRMPSDGLGIETPEDQIGEVEAGKTSGWHLEAGAALQTTS